VYPTARLWHETELDDVDHVCKRERSLLDAIQVVTSPNAHATHRS
jgi:hypothetical protein